MKEIKYFISPKKKDGTKDGEWMGKFIVILESIQCKNFLEGCYVKVSTSNIQERRFLIPYG